MAKGRRSRDKAVKKQYEQLPYPPRNPEDERDRLISGSPSHLDEINHYIFGGKRDFSKPFRALVAGGGTGDAAIMLAQQLSDRGTSGSVTYLDLSTASRAVVESRAKVRGLANIEFHTGSLLDLPEMGFDPFDYIDCCGVLHHLEEPEAGLASLKSVLADGGGMGLMLYATLGRTGVYHVQEALKLLVDGDDPVQQLPLAKKLVAGLPSTNWLVRNPFVGDHKMGEDAAFYDLLLHPRDRSYRVAEVLDLLTATEMELVRFLEPVKYDPENFVKDKDVLKQIKSLAYENKAAFAEAITGNIKTHIFYAKKRQDAATSIAEMGPHMIPVLAERTPPTALADTFRGKKIFQVSFDGEKVNFDLPDHIDRIVLLMDGNRTLAEIQTEMSMNWEGFRRLFAPSFKLLNSLNLLWLRQKQDTPS
ncbi:MAG: class I SAM-dependent methyltransferase [Sneathiella sp.]